MFELTCLLMVLSFLLGPPTFLVQAAEDQSPTDFDLVPPSIHVSLDETSPGVVCINCSATGYPDLQYKWSYSAFGGESKNMSSDPCLGFYNNQPEVWRTCTAVVMNLHILWCC